MAGLILTNNFGEETVNVVGAESDVSEIAALITDQEVTSKLLTGLAAGTNTTIAAGDTILQALAKLQAQITGP